MRSRFTFFPARRLALAAALLTTLPVACAGRPPAVERELSSPAAAVPERQPARVMPFEGADWLERPGRTEQEHPEEVLRAMDLHPGDVVAEVGAGTGYFARRIARQVAPDGRVYAVDIQPEMLDLLHRYAERDGVAGTITTVVGGETDPHLPAGAMDWVLLVDVYHEFQQPKPMLAKIRESLKPSGRVALVEYRLEGDTAS